jgi:hypothetical protein
MPVNVHIINRIFQSYLFWDFKLMLSLTLTPNISEPILILTSHLSLDFLSGTFPSVFRPKFYPPFSSLSYAFHMNCHLILHLTSLKIADYVSPYCASFSETPVTFSLLGQSILLGSIFSCIYIYIYIHTHMPTHIMTWIKVPQHAA